MYFLKLLWLIGLLFLWSCSNNTESDASQNDSTDVANTDSSEMMSEQPSIKSELQDYSSWNIDSMKISYNNISDTIYGYRKGDTLIVEGDIIFKYPRQGGMKFITGVGTTRNLWPKKNNVIVVPYTINTSYSQPQLIQTALQMWSQSTNITFVPRTNQTDYVEFVPSDYTRSFVGKTGSKQKIELANWAVAGNIAHEIGHCLGLYHEHTRSDRDNYILLDPACSNNINYRHAYKHDPYARDLANYNFFSIMHYSTHTGCFTIQTIHQSQLPRDIPGQRDSITVGDKVAINQIYGL